jgi:hypothetical protein
MIQKLDVMKEQHHQLKKLVAAYQVALEYDNCPNFQDEGPEQIRNFVQIEISDEDLQEAIEENEGSSPINIVDEIIGKIGLLES